MEFLLSHHTSRCHFSRFSVHSTLKFTARLVEYASRNRRLGPNDASDVQFDRLCARWHCGSDSESTTIRSQLKLKPPDSNVAHYSQDRLGLGAGSEYVARTSLPFGEHQRYNLGFWKDGHRDVSSSSFCPYA